MTLLSPDDRSALISALRPPPGMVLGQAVATTFTLDLETAMSIPIAFARGRSQDLNDPISVMEALRDCRDRIDIFCQAGAIRPPTTQSTLFAFLEPMITQVWQQSRLFHPKIWLLRYDGPLGSRMRLLVLTRNLTADRAWDLAVSLDGEVDPKQRRDRSLPELVRWALSHTKGPALDPRRAERLQGLLDDAARTVWEKPADAWEVTLHALGVGLPNTLKLVGTRALVVSPFVQADGLDLIEARTRVVVSRPEELDRLDAATLDRVDARVLNEAAWLSEGGEDNQLTGLHAKAYVIEYDRRAWNILGSPNATRPGLVGDRRANVEFAVTLEGSKWDLGIDRWLSDNSLGHLLVEYDRQAPSAPDETSEALESTLRSLAGVSFSARAAADGDAWSELVWPEEPLRYPPTQQVGVELLTTRGRRHALANGSSDAVVFASLTIPEVTPFLILTVVQDGQSASACLRATLLDDVPDRLDHVLMGQVDTAEKFLRWLLLLLAEDPGAGFLVPLDEERSGGSWLVQAQQRGLFEAMVTSLADHPEQLHLIERFVCKVLSSPHNRQVLPEGFVELWQVVRTALAQGAAA